MKHQFRPLFVVLALLATLWQTPALAQSKTLSMEDAILNRSLIPQNLSQLQWIPGEDDFAYVEKNQLLEGSAKSSKRETLLTVDQLSAALQKAGGKEVKGFPMLHWKDDNTLFVINNNKLFEINLKDRSAKAVTGFVAEAENQDLSPDKQKIAYTLGNNLFVSAPGADDVAITSEKNEGIVNGQAAHRSEFGITKGIFWSPKSDKIAYYRMDQSMVSDYPLVDLGPLPAAQQPIKYPMAGGISHQVTVGVYDLNSKKTIFLNTGEPAEQYLTNITWSPDQKYIYIAVLNRAQNHMKLNQYDAATGNFIKTLFEDKQEKYVEPEHGLFFVPGKNDQFVWISERSGFDHLYLYNTDGKLIRQLTSGNWMVTDLLGFDKKGQKVFFSSTKESPLERHFYSVNLSNGNIQKLSQGTGTHHAKVNDDGDYIIDNFSSQVTPRKIWVIDDNGKVRQTLLTAENPVKNYAIGETKIFPIKADDG
ncbi:MAG: DPP IV N-terminal domain-containing protein, partial [Hymenobacteraceae bacterium]|nr:DPP IV N-terminal domain-containing protein [Hymenobacteraceae bacterium]MDX5397498.1 DPP IV N-terminal domain-containing protein [Hymenobacteraceae bacterium]MDX5513577.1 DPP IV N-terminal domain-containing protein [Hymenobacteraceae bacterium]